jgi:hypothetical protein
LAFVNRLEELGNDSANRGDFRGSVADFKAQDFAAALDISVEDAHKLYAILQHPEVGWIADGVIADFHDRNPDVEDPTAAERQRRRRAREKICRMVAEKERAGFISGEERLEIENRLPRLGHPELVNLQVELEAKSLQTSVTRDSRMSRRDRVTTSANLTEPPSSAPSETQNVTCDNATVTLDQNKPDRPTLSATIPKAASLGSASLPKEENEIVSGPGTDPAIWLNEKGSELIMNRMDEPYERAMTRLSGWSERVRDPAILAGILQCAQDRSGHSFHMEVSDQIRRLAG